LTFINITGKTATRQPVVTCVHVAELWHYPVKSMRGVRLEQAELRAGGIAGDRLVQAIALDGAREPQRRHRGLRPRRDEAHLLDRRHGVGDLLRELHLSLGGRAEARAVECRGAHRLDRLGVCVAVDERPPRLHPVEQAPAVGRLEVRALPARDEERLVHADRAHRAHRGVDPARDRLQRPVPELAPF